MSPSIAELFGQAEGESTSGVDIDIDRLNAEFDSAIGSIDHGVQEPPAPAGQQPPGVPARDLSIPGGGEPEGETGGVPPSPAGLPSSPIPGAVPSGTATTPPAPAEPLSPFESMSAIERESLLSLHRVMSSDPAKRDAVLRAVVGGGESAPPPAPIAAAPPTPPAPPKLPDDIDEGTPEARLWHQQQEFQNTLDQMREVTRAQQASQARSLAADAASRAANAFAARYGGSLSQDDMMAVAQQAATRGLPAALARAAAPAGAEPTASQLESAYYTAMDMTMRANDVYLAKVLGASAQPSAVAPPANSEDRKRKLTAISGAAGPAGGGSGRPSLTTRPDGRLDEKSRTSVIQQAADALKGMRQEF